MRVPYLVLLLCVLPALVVRAADARSTIYVDNVKGNEVFNGQAAAPDADGKTGPVASIMQAVRIAPVSAVISIANTGTPYRESVKIEGYRKGRAALPMVLDGHGATVTGLVVVPAARWTKHTDDIYWFENKLEDGKFGRMPNSNWLGHWKHQGWFTEAQAPEIFFADGKPGPNVRKLEEIPQGGFFYDTQSSPRRLYYRLPAGKTIEQVTLELPLNTGVYVSDDYVVVRNMISIYSQDDGFAGFWGIGVVFENINGSYNCDQGYSMHGTSTSIVDGGLFERNGGAGIVDVMSCMSLFRNVTVRNNMIAGVIFEGHAHSMLSSRAYGNYATQISGGGDTTVNLTNVLVNGLNTGTGVSIALGRLDRVTIVNCETGLYISQSGSVLNSNLQACNTLLRVQKAALPTFRMQKTLLGLGTVVLGDQTVTKDTWAEVLPLMKNLADIIIEPLALTEPLYALPKDSPYIKFGQYGLTPGAMLPEEKTWAPLDDPQPPVPHP